MRLVCWLGWALFIAAWTDWGLAALLGYDVWKQDFGIIIPGAFWNMTPVMVASFGIVLIATCRRA